MVRRRFLALCSVSLAACGGSASVQLQLHNVTGAGAPVKNHLTTAAVMPSELAIRMTAVYLAEGVDPVTLNNTGRSAMIWINAECQGSIDQCNVDGEPGPGPRIKSYFDFAAGSDAVNRVLNAQALPVEAGTYRYARIEFCKIAGSQPVQPNVEWSVPGLAAPRRFGVGMCGVTSQPFASPLVLKAGDTVTVALAYDLAASTATIADDQPSGPGCVGGQDSDHCYMDCLQSGGSRTCVRAPVFTPAVVAVTSHPDGGSAP